VVIDEGTRLQSTETHIANGVRTLDPRFRMVLTGTPIKNRLESFFWLGWWVAGGSALGNPLWPYEATHSARERFANEHLLRMRGDSGRASRTARITNIHDLWHLIAPIVLRRRKSDCGEEIVRKIVKPIRLQPGREQALVYSNHLRFPPYMSSKNRAVKGFGQVAMQLNILRQAALCPHTDAIGRVHSMATGPKQSTSDFNPKLATCLALVAKLIAKGEQVIIGSPFRAFSHSLHDRLASAGVSSLLLDGETKPGDRGRLAEEFKTGVHSVLVVGIAAMSEGHSFENCSHLILPSLSWAYDENAQFVDRVWRLNSPKDVTVYTLITAGTIDERLAELFSEKKDSAQLALDGRLIGEDIQETDLAALLRYSVRAFDRAAPTICESQMQLQWNTNLSRRLTRSERRYREIREPEETNPKKPEEFRQ
jgi:SNF2 family DNA or RNA helicase